MSPTQHGEQLGHIQRMTAPPGQYVQGGTSGNWSHRAILKLLAFFTALLTFDCIYYWANDLCSREESYPVYCNARAIWDPFSEIFSLFGINTEFTWFFWDFWSIIPRIAYLIFRLFILSLIIKVSAFSGTPDTAHGRAANAKFLITLKGMGAWLTFSEFILPWCFFSISPMHFNENFSQDTINTINIANVFFHIERVVDLGMLLTVAFTVQVFLKLDQTKLVTQKYTLSGWFQPQAPGPAGAARAGGDFQNVGRASEILQKRMQEEQMEMGNMAAPAAPQFGSAYGQQPPSFVAKDVYGKDIYSGVVAAPALGGFRGEDVEISVASAVPAYGEAMAPPTFNPTTGGGGGGGGGSMAERIKALAELKDQGLLTEEEFSEGKAKIIRG